MSLQDGDTGLILAARKGHAATVKVVLDHGASVDIQNKVHAIVLSSDLVSRP